RLAGTFAAHSARPRGRSELDLLRQRQGIVDFDPEVTDGALNLRMSEKQLDRSQVTGLTVDLRRLGATQRVCAISAAVHSRALDPAMHDARVFAAPSGEADRGPGSERRRGLESLVARSAILAARRGFAP